MFSFVEEMPEYLSAVVDEHFRYLVALGVLIAYGVYLAIVKA